MSPNSWEALWAVPSMKGACWEELSTISLGTFDCFAPPIPGRLVVPPSLPNHQMKMAKNNSEPAGTRTSVSEGNELAK